ncbi:MAG TPA: hypothetical protein VLF21_02630 [Candidatus Saccharimonadales bacterium]|nr:hypothetical protein [Candidatus Saccharimonadales bacterium]
MSSNKKSNARKSSKTLLPSLTKSNKTMLAFVAVFAGLGVYILAQSYAAKPGGTRITLVATAVGAHQVNASWSGPIYTDASYRYLAKLQCANGAYYNSETNVETKTVLAEKTYYSPNFYVPASTACTVVVELQSGGKRGFKAISTSNTVSLTTPAETADTTPPSVPTGLTATLAYPTYPAYFKLTWNPSSDNVGVTGYDVGYGFSPIPVNFDNSGVAYMSVYNSQTFVVRARDANGNVSAWSAPINVVK